MPNNYSISFTVLTIYLDCKQIGWVHRNLPHYCGKRPPKYQVFYMYRKSRNPDLLLIRKKNFINEGSKTSDFLYFQYLFIQSSNILIQGVHKWSSYRYTPSILFMNSKLANLNSMLCNRAGTPSIKSQQRNDSLRKLKFNNPQYFHFYSFPGVFIHFFFLDYLIL